MLSGFIDNRNTTAFPFNPDPDRYKPAPTGGAASSYELDVTDQGFRFPQTWRTNIGVDQRLPWGLIGTMDFIYNRDLNAPVYINANLPAPQSAFTGVDTRPRWVANSAYPACAATGGQVGPCVTRLNNAPGNQITAAYVIKNQSDNRSWNYAASLSKTHHQRLRGSRAGSATACPRAWSSRRPRPAARGGRPTRSASTRTTRTWPTRTTRPASGVPAVDLFRRSYFDFGATTISVFYEGRTNGNTSYVFSGDANGDTVSGNDLIYIPRNAVGDELRDLHGRRPNLHRGRAGGGVRAATSSRTRTSASTAANTPSEARCSCRWSSAWT